MITQNINSWQNSIKNCITCPKKLIKLLNLEDSNIKLNPKFKLKVPLEYIDKIKKSDIKDPLLLQILPTLKEDKIANNFIQDPLNENSFINKNLPGLIQKYSSRVLITLSKACAINCRYCFRREFPYDKNIPGTKILNKIFIDIEKNKNIKEVILSGGEPLTCTDNYIKNIINTIEKIPNITTVRFHTRMAAIIPNRITENLINIFNNSRLKIVIIFHINHPNEIDNNLKTKTELLKKNNITLLNQSVLLNNINNNSKTLMQLSEKLFDCNILPYYLHILDKVTGTSHFEVDINSAKKIISEIRANLPGYLVPRLVQEIPGENSKTVIT